MGKLKRLRAMPAKEIGYRFRERMRTERERFQTLLGTRIQQAQDDRAQFITIGYLARLFDAKFYFAPSDRQSIRQFVEKQFSGWTTAATLEAEQLCRHNVELLGYDPVSLGRHIDWHKDPITAAMWPKRFWADYDLVNGPFPGDAKIIHELNRHQHLPRLAKAFFLSGDEYYAEEAVSQMLDWIYRNPEGMGINWQSSLEIAIRVISWLWTIAFLVTSAAFTENVAHRVTRSLIAQLRHVCRHLSVYSSPNTHLIGEAAALFIAGTLFADTPLMDNKEAAGWRDSGLDILVEESNRQILADGVHCELSSYYHCYTVDFYLQALLLARRNRIEMPASVSHKLEAMLDFVMHVSRPDGSLPLLGDDDGGRALALDHKNYRSYLDGLSVGALVFQRPDFKRQSRAFHQEAFWLLGNNAWSAYQNLDAAPPEPKAHAFLDAGYFVQHSGWDASDDHLIFDCGGLGAPTGGHGHADALSLVLSAGSQEMLVDSGTGLYNAAPQWRNYFRSTRSHSTVVVDALDQSTQGGTFQWQTRANARERRHFSAGEIDYLEAEHTGYARLADPITHKRRVLYCRPDYWMVVDELTGCGKHKFDIQYNLSPDLTLAISSNPDEPIHVIGHPFDADPKSGLLLFIDSPHHLACSVTSASDTPIDGWVSPQYGAVRPGQMLRASVACAAPLLAASVLAPFATHRTSTGPMAVRRANVQGCALAYSINNGAHVDYLLVPGADSAFRFKEFQLQGELFWMRTTKGAVQELLGVGVRQIEHESTIFAGPAVADHVWARFTDDCVVIENSTTEDKTYVRNLRNTKV